MSAEYSPTGNEVNTWHDALQSIARDPDACNCASVHSWYGEGHTPACPVEVARYALGRQFRLQRRAAKRVLGDMV